jgi:deoxyadenosine/deoxycytidine kinase
VTSEVVWILFELNEKNLFLNRFYAINLSRSVLMLWSFSVQIFCLAV